MSRKTTLIPKRIAQIRFSLMDPVEIRKMSSVEVKTPDTYKDDGHAYRQGLMDPHMGVIEPGLVCPTDNCKYDESPGHFGHIQLELPVIHIGFVVQHTSDNFVHIVKPPFRTCPFATVVEDRCFYELR